MSEETKKKAEHTPEPWDVEYIGGSLDVVGPPNPPESTDAHPGGLRPTIARLMNGTGSERRANAHLLAAAPNLAKAEQRWLDPLPDPGDVQAIREWVVARRADTRDALEKAEAV